MMQEQLAQLNKLFDMENRVLLSTAEARSFDILESITLSLECCDVKIAADAEFDTVRVELANREHDSPRPTNACAAPWSNYVGLLLSWAWLTVNYQGYPDGVVLSFDAGTDAARDLCCCLLFAGRALSRQILKSLAPATRTSRRESNILRLCWRAECVLEFSESYTRRPPRACYSFVDLPSAIFGFASRPVLQRSLKALQRQTHDIAPRSLFHR